VGVPFHVDFGSIFSAAKTGLFSLRSEVENAEDVGVDEVESGVNFTDKLINSGVFVTLENDDFFFGF
jgi:hypothetical protein